MNVSCTSAEAQGNGSARMRAGARWNACGNESGAGEERRSGTIMRRQSGPLRGSRESHEISLPY